MCSTDVGDNTYLRVEHSHQGIHLSLVVYPHLEHAELVVFADGEHGKRKAYL